MTRPDYNNPCVIVLGAATFRKTPSLNRLGFRSSADDFISYILDQTLFGLPSQNLLNLFDSDLSPGDQLERMADFLSSRRSDSGCVDVIVYYVGHGGFVPVSQEYFLAISNTRDGFEGSTAIRISDFSSTLRDYANQCRKYLILDCCFAASVFAQFQSTSVSDAVSAQVLEPLPETGTALLCSSGSRQVSLAPAEESHTMFSGALMQVLRRGEKSATPAFSLDDVARQVKDMLRKNYPDQWIRPELHCPDMRRGSIAEIPLFPNPQFSPDLHSQSTTSQFEYGMDNYLSATLQAVNEILGLGTEELSEVGRKARHLLVRTDRRDHPTWVVEDVGLNSEGAGGSADSYVRNLEALVNARTQQWKTALANLEKSYDVTLEALGDALDLKDAESEGHSKRITAYTIAIARKMGLSKQEISIIARGAFLHDIGKMAVPDSILRKRSRLTDEEMTVMREHVYAGYKMVNKVPFLSEAAEIIYAHHESFDGQGYPRGLSGDEIPLGARIVAVADALETMTVEQCDGGANTFAEARRFIESEAGKRFDPHIVRAFMEMPEKIWSDLRRDIDKDCTPSH